MRIGKFRRVSLGYSYSVEGGRSLRGREFRNYLTNHISQLSKESTGNTIACSCISLDGQWGLIGGRDNNLHFIDLTTGKCIRLFRGHSSWITAVDLSDNHRWAISGSEDGILRLWELDWNYEFPEFADWNEDASPYSESFLVTKCKYSSENRLGRIGKPDWNDIDFEVLINNLQYCGYGWLRPEGVRKKLEEMTANWQELIPRQK